MFAKPNFAPAAVAPAHYPIPPSPLRPREREGQEGGREIDSALYALAQGSAPGAGASGVFAPAPGKSHIFLLFADEGRLISPPLPL